MSINVDAELAPGAAGDEQERGPAGGDGPPVDDRSAFSRRRPWHLGRGDGAAGRRRDRAGRRGVLVALAAAVALPVLWTGVAAARHAWYPAGDWADVALGAIEVGTEHTPLVGVYSRYGWNHPGPMMFWLYAVPYRLLGGSFAGMILAASAINAASLAASVALAWRRGGIVLAGTVATTLAIVVHTLGPALVRDPWNPWVTVLPFGLLVLAAWAAVDGDRAALVVAAVVGSFLAQTHIGFVPLVGLLLAVAGAGFARRSPSRRSLVIAAAVLVVCWSPVVVHVVTGGDNVFRLVEHFTAGDESAGLSHAFGVTALELGGRGPWAGAPEPGMPAGGGVEPGVPSLLAVPVLVFAVALALAWRARRTAPGPLRLQVVVGVSALAGLLAVSRISGNVFSYLIRWWWPLVALWWASIIWSLWCSLAPRLEPRTRRRAVAALAALAVLLSGKLAIGMAGRDTGLLESVDGNAAQSPLAYFTEDVLPAVPVDRPVLFRQVGPDVGWVGDGLALQLVRSGRDVRFEDQGSNRFKYGEDRMSAPVAEHAGLVLMSGGLGIEDLASRGGGRLLGRWDPLTPAERQEASALHHKLRGVFSQLGREDLVSAIDIGASLWDAQGLPEIDPQDFERFHELRERGEPLALFLYERADLAPART